MTRCLYGRLALVAVIVLGLCPAAAEAAAVISFRNDTDSPVIVRGVSIINRVARRGQLHLLRPGEVGRELILVPGPMLILFIVADPNQPTRVLCQEAILFRGVDLFYAIQVEVPDKPKEGDKGSSKTKDQKPVTPKVKLVPSKPKPPATTAPPQPRN